MKSIQFTTVYDEEKVAEWLEKVCNSHKVIHWQVLHHHVGASTHMFYVFAECEPKNKEQPE